MLAFLFMRETLTLSIKPGKVFSFLCIPSILKIVLKEKKAISSSSVNMYKNSRNLWIIVSPQPLPMMTMSFDYEIKGQLDIQFKLKHLISNFFSVMNASIFTSEKSTYIVIASRDMDPLNTCFLPFQFSLISFLYPQFRICFDISFFLPNRTKKKIPIFIQSHVDSLLSYHTVQTGRCGNCTWCFLQQEKS